MISGYAQAGYSLNITEYINTAEKAMEFLEKHVFLENDLLRTCYVVDGKVTNLETPIHGCVDDFSNLVAASLDLFQATMNVKHLLRAEKVSPSQYYL